MLKRFLFVTVAVLTASPLGAWECDYRYDSRCYPYDRDYREGYQSGFRSGYQQGFEDAYRPPPKPDRPKRERPAFKPKSQGAGPSHGNPLTKDRN
jgi:hypothetical protein